MAASSLWTNAGVVGGRGDISVGFDRRLFGANQQFTWLTIQDAADHI
jgi:hypothetical protein